MAPATGKMQGGNGCICKGCLRLLQRDTKKCGRTKGKDILCYECRGNPYNTNYDLCKLLKDAGEANTKRKNVQNLEQRTRKPLLETNDKYVCLLGASSFYNALIYNDVLCHLRSLVHRRYRATANNKKKEDCAKTKEKKDNQDMTGQVATADENFASRQRHSLQKHASIETAKLYDAREWFAKVYPELVIIAVTDGYFRTSTGEFCLNMYGLSCKTVRADMLDAWKLRNAVYGPLYKQGFDPAIKPRCRFSIFFDDAVMVGSTTNMYEEDTPPHKSITLLKGVSTDDTEFHTFDWIEKVSGQVEDLRKAIQACYDTGVNANG
jgi:hypothetical protein